MTIQTISQLKANIAADLADNTTGDINPSDVRTNMDDTVDTLFSYTPDTRVIVKTANELGGTLSSNVQYFIDGKIDMGTTQIKVPETGLNLIGEGFDISTLFSSEDNYTMFVKEDAGTYAGFIRCSSVGFNITGASSALFGCDNDENNGSVEFESCNFGEFSAAMTSIGELSNYRLVRFDGHGFINVSDGLTLSGTMSGGFNVTSSIALSLPAMTLIKEGTSLVINGDCLSDMNFNSVNAAAEYTDIQDSNITNDGSFILSKFRTTATDAIPNIDGQSVKADYSNCQGITNTYVGGVMTITNDAETTIGAVNTPVKAAGVTTGTFLSSFDMPTNNRLRYISSVPREVSLKTKNSLTGGSNDTGNVYVRHYGGDDVLKSIIDVTGFRFSEVGDVANSTCSGFASIVENDYFEFWLENTLDSSNITLEDNSKMLIKER